MSDQLILKERRLSQLSFKALMVLGIFGLIPGAWMVGFPLLTLYGAIKLGVYRYSDPKGFKEQFDYYINLYSNLKKDASKFIFEQDLLQYVKNNPAHVAKLTLSFMIMFTWMMPFSFLAVYGLFSYSNEEWMNLFGKRFNAMVTRILNLFYDSNKITNPKIKILAKMAATAGLAVLLVAASYLFSEFTYLTAYLFGSGVVAPLGIAWLGLSLLQVCVVSIGATVFFRDLKEALKNPVRKFLENPGKFYGMVWGRWLAYWVFPGEVVGTIGASSGQVLTTGASFLEWFTFSPNGMGLFGFLFSKLTSFFNGIISGLVFSHNMQLHGNFQGYIGPTAFQVFACMALGCFVGYCIERFVNDLYDTVGADAKAVAQSSSNFLYRSRWQMSFIASITPAVLISPVGPVFLELAVGNSILAAGLVFSSGLVTLGLLYGLRNVLKSFDKSVSSSPEVLPTPNVPVPTPSVSVPTPSVSVPTPSVPEADPVVEEALSSSANDPIVPAFEKEAPQNAPQKPATKKRRRKRLGW